MNPQSQNAIFLRLSQATVSQAPASGRHESEFRIEIGRDDVIGFVGGILVTLLVQVVVSRLRSRPAPWWKAGRSGRIKIDDLRHGEFGDSLLPVDALRIAR